MTSKRSVRGGFTLVELLVVISIIGMLMALLLPAVQQARETGRQNTCRSNQHQLALAMLQKETVLKRYPGYVDLVGWDVNGVQTIKTWGFLLLPYLDHNDYYERYVNNNDQITQTLEVMQCASDPPDGTTNLPHASFVLNTGRQDFNYGANSTYPLDWKDNGVFQNVIPTTLNGLGGGTTYTRPVVHMNSSFLTARDGTQNTILLCENIDASSWVLGDKGTDDTLWEPGTLDEVDELQFERQLGCIWNGTWDVPTARLLPTAITLPINAGAGTDPTGTDFNYCRPSSIHPTGVNITFADAHTRFMSQDIDYTVLAMLFSSNGRAVLDPGDIVISAHMAALRLQILDERDL